MSIKAGYRRDSRHDRRAHDTTLVGGGLVKNPAIAGFWLFLGVVLTTVAAAPGFAKGLERVAEAGGVTATALPLNPNDVKAPTLDFSVVMDSHSGSLPLDVAKVASAMGPSGAAIPATAWNGGRGGHHLTGTLSFPSGTLRSTAPLTLTLRGDGSGQLVFVWAGAIIGASGEGTPVSVDGGSYLNITPATLNAILVKKDFLFVNVHIPYEGEIALTDAFIPYDQTKASLDKYPAEKSAKIVVYCRSGRMSDIAARELVRQGYTQVLNLDGGMIEWEKSGLALKRSQGKS
jgi:rhodanese-related sulfurtransferase